MANKENVIELFRVLDLLHSIDLPYNYMKLENETKEVVKPPMISEKHAIFSNTYNCWCYQEYSSNKFYGKIRVKKVYLSCFSKKHILDNFLNVLNDKSYVDVDFDAMSRKLEATVSIYLDVYNRLISNNFQLSGNIFILSNLMKSKHIDFSSYENIKFNIQETLIKYLGDTVTLDDLANISSTFKLLDNSLEIPLFEFKDFLVLIETSNSKSTNVVREELITDDSNLDFYGKDLLEVNNSKTLGKNILSFLEQTKPSNRINVMKDDVSDMLTKDKFPLGKWIDDKDLSLKQQLAVNIFTQRDMLSVNGAPGTGKTTLVNNVIADIVVKKAKNIISAEYPFYKIEIYLDNKRYDYYEVSSDILGNEVVIVSNSNQAVENITKVIPNRASIDYKKLPVDFSYFTDFSNMLYNTDTWGLISVPLGNSDNNNNFIKKVLYSTVTKNNVQEEVGLIKRLYEREENNFEDVKKEFLDLLEEESKFQVKEVSLDEIGPVVNDREWNDVRVKLFIKALEVTREFIYKYSYEISNNLTILYHMLKGKQVYQTKKINVLNNLFLIVPVISTTLASVSKLFDGVYEEEIGNLIIDEGGQALPYSTVGALYRAKKVLCLGDPAQLEPIINVSPSLLEKLADNFNVDRKFVMHNSLIASTQTLLDSVSEFYGTINDEVVGCPLLIHRRCNQETFNISNEISYGNSMIYFKDEVESKLPKSGWINVKSCNYRNHSSIEEKNTLAEFIKNLNVKYSLNDNDYYIITPFRSTENDVKGYPIGTIHKMQGREKKVIILLLGGSSNEAISWACSKPNLLNVAVTRAKERLYIIGDYDKWGNKQFFEVCKKYIKIYGEKK